jgi:hypothetical protein
VIGFLAGINMYFTVLLNSRAKKTRVWTKQSTLPIAPFFPEFSPNSIRSFQRNKNNTKINKKHPGIIPGRFSSIITEQT